MGGGGEGDRSERHGAFDEKTQVGAKIYNVVFKSKRKF